MFIEVQADGSLELQDQDNFRTLSLVCPPERRGAMEASFPGRVDQTHVWISQDWLREATGDVDPAWQVAFEKMVDYAAAHGWTDEHQRIRIHIQNS